MASLIWLKATVARLMMDSTLFSSPLRASQGFRLTNAIPEFCPSAAEAEAVNGKDAFNVGLLVMQVVISHRIQDLLRALLGSTGRQLDHGQEDALVFVGQKGRVQAHEQHGHPHDDQQVDHQITASST